jgi:hypothetical protein
MRTDFGHFKKHEKTSFSSFVPTPTAKVRQKPYQADSVRKRA